jgi:hypothetical protein
VEPISLAPIWASTSSCVSRTTSPGAGPHGIAVEIDLERRLLRSGQRPSQVARAVQQVVEPRSELRVVNDLRCDLRPDVTRVRHLSASLPRPGLPTCKLEMGARGAQAYATCACRRERAGPGAGGPGARSRRGRRMAHVSVGRGVHAPSHVHIGLFASVPGRRAA